MKYKITIESINENEYDETDYHFVNKNSQEPCDYNDRDAVKAYFKTGKKLIRLDRETVFEQTLPEGQVDITKIIKATNNLE